MFNQFTNSQFGSNSGDNMNYNDCSIEGYCSIDPIVYSLMEVMLYELKQVTYYYLKMQELGYENKKLKNKILDYLSLVLIGYEFNREDFIDILKEIHNTKEAVRESFTNICEQKNLDCQILKSNIKFEKFAKFDLASIVTQGEQQAILRNKTLNQNMKILYEIILNLIKSSSIRLIELQAYSDEYLPEEDSILRLFNNLNFSTMTEAKLIRKINDFAKINLDIHKKHHKINEEYYGKITLNDVLVGVKAGKSILVSGQNLKDLELLLEAAKGTDINVYTHNGLIVAHAYPKFAQYPNLIGHYQNSLDSVQFDFVSFNGPVLVIRNFQYLLDRLYRGRIFTTNIIAGKGMTKIENMDYTPLINSALTSTGFDSDYKLADVKVGYDEKCVMEKVDALIEKIINKKIKHIVFIGLLNHPTLESNYYKELVDNLPEDYASISTIQILKQENSIYFDSFFNSSLIYKILGRIKEKIDIEKFPISLFLTTCNLHTISHLFNLKQLGIKNVYLPNCTSNIITPNMLKFLKNKFNFKQASDDPVNDVKEL